MTKSFVGDLSPRDTPHIDTRKSGSPGPLAHKKRESISARGDTSSVCVVLPAFNEQDALIPVVTSIAATMNEYQVRYSIIIVDDGSDDRTAEIASDLGQEFPVDLIKHPKNMGLAQAMRTGLKAATKISDENDIVVTMDADNTHPAGLIDRMRRLISEGHDVVIASRYQSGSRVLGVPLFRRATALGARLLFTLILPIRGVRDYTCGFRAYRVSLLTKAFERYDGRFIEEQGFSCMAEILLKLGKMKPIAGEVPMILRYDRKDGESKMAVGNTIVQTLRMALRIRFSRS